MSNDEADIRVQAAQRRSLSWGRLPRVHGLVVGGEEGLDPQFLGGDVDRGADGRHDREELELRVARVEVHVDHWGEWGDGSRSGDERRDIWSALKFPDEFGGVEVGDGPRAKNGPALAGHGAEAVRDAIVASIGTLPEQLRRSLTWDQGAEMAQNSQLRIDTGLAVYFCDPQSPWQRGTNENTNGLLRQYFPKGTDLSKHSPDDLAAVAAALNGRPRKTLGWRTPAEALDELLLSA
jgi:hypothetical protein